MIGQALSVSTSQKASGNNTFFLNAGYSNFSKRTKANRPMAATYVSVAESLAKIEKYDEAIKYLQSAIRLVPEPD